MRTPARTAGDAVTITYARAAFANKMVGSNKPVTVTGIAINGADKNNYIVSLTTTAMANITVRTLVVSATGVSKAYDGNTSATVTLSDDRVPGDVLSASYISASFATAAAGTNKPITVNGITITGADAGNYSANATANATASITTKLVTGSITAADKVYDGTRDAVVTGQSLSGVFGKLSSASGRM